MRLTVQTGNGPCSKRHLTWPDDSHAPPRVWSATVGRWTARQNAPAAHSFCMAVRASPFPPSTRGTAAPSGRESHAPTDSQTMRHPPPSRQQCPRAIRRERRGRRCARVGPAVCARAQSGGAGRDGRAPHTRRRERVGGDVPGGSGDKGAAGAPCVAGSPARARRAGGARAAASGVGRRRGRRRRRVDGGRPPWAALPKGGGVAVRGGPWTGAAGGGGGVWRVARARAASVAAARVGPAGAATVGRCGHAAAGGDCRRPRAPRVLAIGQRLRGGWGAPPPPPPPPPWRPAATASAPLLCLVEETAAALGEGGGGAVPRCCRVALGWCAACTVRRRGARRPHQCGRCVAVDGDAALSCRWYHAA